MITSNFGKKKTMTKQKNISTATLNTGAGKWFGRLPIFQILATSQNLRNEKASKLKIKVK